MVALDKQISFRLTEVEHQQVKVACALNGETLQDVGRRLLLDYVARTEGALPTYAGGEGDGE